MLLVMCTRHMYIYILSIASKRVTGKRVAQTRERERESGRGGREGRSERGREGGGQ